MAAYKFTGSQLVPERRGDIYLARKMYREAVDMYRQAPESGIERKGGGGLTRYGAELNAQPEVLTFRDGTAQTAVVLDIEQERIQGIHIVVNPGMPNAAITAHFLIMGRLL